MHIHEGNSVCKMIKPVSQEITFQNGHFEQSFECIVKLINLAISIDLTDAYTLKILKVSLYKISVTNVKFCVLVQYLHQRCSMK